MEMQTDRHAFFTKGRPDLFFGGELGGRRRASFMQQSIESNRRRPTHLTPFLRFR